VSSNESCRASSRITSIRNFVLRLLYASAPGLQGCPEKHICFSFAAFGSNTCQSTTAFTAIFIEPVMHRWSKKIQKRRVLALDRITICAYCARWHSSHCFCTTVKVTLSDWNDERRARGACTRHNKVLHGASASVLDVHTGSSVSRKLYSV
jgi:hypothetical protein